MAMKRITKIALFSVLALLAAVSCRKEKEEPLDWRTELQVLKSNLVFMPGGGTETLEVNLSNVSVTADKSWCSVSVSGNTISVAVPANEDKLSRYAKLTITSGSESLTAAVIQYGEVFDGMELVDMEVSNKGAQFAYPYTSNLDVDVQADQPWVHITFDEEDPIVYVTVDKNEGFGTRFATVTYTAGSHSGSAQVIQDPTYGEVPGWAVEDVDGRYVFPDQIDMIQVTPSSAMASAPYFWTLGDPSELIGKDVPAFIRESAAEVKAAIEAGYAKLSKGTDAKEYTNLPSTAKAIIIVFDEKNYPTGQYVVMDVAVPDRGPKKELVDGWEVSHSGGSWLYPDQTDEFTITPKAGYENLKYIATAVKKEAVANVEDFAFTNFAMSTREEILAKVASGELASFEDGLESGTSSVSIQNAAGEVYVVVVAFGDNQFYTGQYAAPVLEVADLKPAMYKWVGKWSVARKNSNYDDIDTWEITVKEVDKTLQIVGIESFSDPTRHYAEATTNADGDLVLKVQYTGAYEDSSRGHVDVLLSGQYDDTAAGKTYYTSSVGTTLFTGHLSEDGNSADLTPGPINGYYFKNIQFYGRYKNSSGGTSAVSWNAGPTAIPQTITRIVE
jgi:hypothetical protein